MNNKSLLAVGVATVGVWFIGQTAAMLLANAISELSWAVVGIVLLVIAKIIGRPSAT